MRRDVYLEMCEALGNEPIEEEIPVELDDLPHFVQQVLQMYYMLTDIWDPMGGNYLGKDNTNIFEFFRLYEFCHEEKLLAISLLQHMDGIRSKIISSKKPTKPSSKKA